MEINSTGKPVSPIAIAMAMWTEPLAQCITIGPVDGKHMYSIKRELQFSWSLESTAAVCSSCLVPQLWGSSGILERVLVEVCVIACHKA